MRRALPALFLLGACASSKPPLQPSDFDVDVPWERGAGGESGERPAFHSATYHLTWEGARVGEAQEVFERTDDGVRLTRTERIHVTRSGLPVETKTEVVIDADAELRATRVSLDARVGATSLSGRAVRADDGSWVLSLEGEPVRRAPAEAVPAELVPFLVARHEGHRYQVPVLLAGYGFAVADLTVRRKGRRALATLGTDWGDIETELRLDEEGALVRAASGSTGALRVEPTRLEEPFDPPELPGQSSIPLSGRGEVLVLRGAGRPAPELEVGPSIERAGADWRVRFDRQAPEPAPELAALVREVDELLGEALDAPGAGPAAARKLGRGDCTAHAALFADLAAERGFDARLVTGYRVDGDRLVRHRWAAVRRGDGWVEVDPTFGEAPAKPGRLLALALHRPTTADMALVDEVVFHDLGGARARWQAPTVARGR